MLATMAQRLRDLDAADPLRAHRDKFQLQDNIIYLDGNSLGCLAHSARKRAEQAVASEWGDGLIRSWLGAGWRTLSTRVGNRIGRLVGAAPGQVLAVDSTSINLYKTVAAALGMRPERKIILSDQGNFPTDLYIIESIAAQIGCAVRIVAPQDVMANIDESVAVVALTHVDYKTSAVYDMAKITAHAHKAGAMVVWDLAHTAGAVPCELDRWNVDFAVGCGYKYLNGGPGAPAFLYVAGRHQASAEQPLKGWFGHRDQFDFMTSYIPASGVERFSCGTPPVIGLSALDGALDAFDDVDIGKLAAKSQKMVDVFLELFDEYLRPRGFALTSERDPRRRGSHVSFSHPQGYQITRALADRGIIGDFRAPDVLRFGFAPLYNRYADIGALIHAVVDIMQDAAWDRAEYRERSAVT